MIKAENLTKRYRHKTAVNDLSFTVEPGKVTGFLGPNGSGKSTTIRMMLGLANGQGDTTFDGQPLKTYKQPSQLVGILLEAKAFHPTRTARNHLQVLAAAGGIPGSRVAEVLDIVGLTEEAKSKPGKFSLGMGQRLGIAAAILGQPKYLILDEPANGLDPEGMAWLRNFLKDYAKAGNGVFVSSHLLSEMSLMADKVVVIGKGKLITEAPVSSLIAKGTKHIFVRVAKTADLKKLLDKQKLNYEEQNGGLLVESNSSDDIGKLAFEAKTAVLELARDQGSLEEAFLELTHESQEFQARPSKETKKWYQR